MCFQLSNIVINGLKSLNSTINSESTKSLISNTIKHIIYDDSSKN